MFEHKTCPECGKIFIPAPENIFKTYKNGHLVDLCSYTCYRNVEKRTEEKRKQAKRDRKKKQS